MKKAATRQWLEDVQEHLSTDYLDNRTGLFSSEGFDKRIDPETVAIIRQRINLYLESWVRPNLGKAIDELK